ncbi:MAG: glycosyltransferase [Acidobacteria bacterium]|nr:glycosyltransferase [Acidobacteriota bacterium]
MSATPSSLTTIVPVYNEAVGVQAAIEHIHAEARLRFADHQLLIIESGSTDGSAEICDQLAGRLEGVEVIHQAAREGFGSALRLGFAAARKDLVWVVSSDLPFPLDAIDQAIPLVAEHDCVLSYRCDDDRTLFRKGQSWAYNTLARTVLSLGARHVNSQSKLYRRATIQSLPIVSDGWLIDTEIVYRLQRANARCSEIPVPLTERTTGESTLVPTQPLISLRELLSFAWSERTAA